MARYAILDSDNVIVNTIEWSGDTNEWQPEEGYTTINIDDVAVQSGHRLVDGAFIWQPNATQIERQWNKVRQIRDSILKDSDVLVFPDRWSQYTTEQQTSITAYRQSLRDMPETFSDPFLVEWPELSL